MRIEAKPAKAVMGVRYVRIFSRNLACLQRVATLSMLVLKKGRGSMRFWHFCSKSIVVFSVPRLMRTWRAVGRSARICFLIVFRISLLVRRSLSRSSNSKNSAILQSITVGKKPTPANLGGMIMAMSPAELPAVPLSERSGMVKGEFGPSIRMALYTYERSDGVASASRLCF